MVKMKEIGLEVKAPGKECDDNYCPFHGNLPVRKKTFEGKVVSSKMQKTVVVQMDYFKYEPKFLRSERRRSRILVHNPPCIGAKEGDRVKFAECRPISKTVSFVVIEKTLETEK
jgi:small subunit ribosomal protein S17